MSALDELAQRKHWIVWYYKNGQLEDQKIPCDAKTGESRINVNDPKHWSDYPTALAFCQPHPGYRVGFCFKDTPFVVIDIDSYKLDNGPKLSAHRCALRSLFIDKLAQHFKNTFWQTSPRKGFHLWTIGTIAAVGNTFKVPEYSWVEVHGAKGFITWNPDLSDNGQPILNCQAGIDWLCDLYSVHNSTKTSNGHAQRELDLPTCFADADGPLTEADKDLCCMAAKASNGNGDLFKYLYMGQWQDKYPSQSEADLALCNILTFYADSQEQVARIFHQSELGKRKKAHRRSYLRGLIQKAWDRKLSIPGADAITNQVRSHVESQNGASMFPVQITNHVPLNGSTFIFKRASEYTPRSVDWLSKGYAARRKITLTAGMPGTGKSTIVASQAAAISNGEPWPIGTDKTNSGYTLIYYCDEDDIEDTLLPRLIAHGANMWKIIVLDGKRNGDGTRIPFDPAKDSEMLLQYVQQWKAEIDLLIIDPLVRIVEGNNNESHRVRRALHTINELARHLNCSANGITHFTKHSRDKHILDRVLNSSAFVQVARIVLNTVQVQQTQEYWLVRSKCSNGIPGGGMSYCIDKTFVCGNIETSRIHWNGPIDGDASDLMEKAEGTSTDEKPTQKNKARALLLELLISGQWVPRSVIADEANKRGISPTALKRAKQELDVEDDKPEFQGSTQWRLTLGRVS